MATRGRRPGTLVRAKCCVCGTVEMRSGAGNHSRCTPCKAENKLSPSARRTWYDMTGKEGAGSIVQSAIRAGNMPRASECSCMDCGKQATDYDHRDYNFPLRVQPVCRGCNLRRGPAIPVVGGMQRSIASGRVPYYYLRSVEKMFRTMGIPLIALDGLPRKLNVENWRGLLKHFDGAPELAVAKAA